MAVADGNRYRSQGSGEQKGELECGRGGFEGSVELAACGESHGFRWGEEELDAGFDGYVQVVGDERITDLDHCELAGSVGKGCHEDGDGVGQDGRADNLSGFGGDAEGAVAVGPNGAVGVPEEIVGVVGEVVAPGTDVPTSGRAGFLDGGAGGTVGDEAGEGEVCAVGGDGEAAVTKPVGGEEEEESGGEGRRGAEEAAPIEDCECDEAGGGEDEVRQV